MGRKKKVTTVVTQVTKAVAAPQSNVSGKKKKKAAKKNQSRGPTQNNLRSLFREALLRPDLTGPIRVPRYGGGTRTGLGFDQTSLTITGSATNTIQGVQLLSAFTGGTMNQFAVAASTTALGAGTAAGAGSQFPLGGQMADVNFSAGCLVAYYTGNPLNVQGEVIFGCTLPLSATATYGSLYTYPGVLKFPAARLIEEPLVISARKLSSAADEFIATATSCADLDLPFIFTSGLPAGGTLVVEAFRSWEYRSTTSNGSVIPYEKVGDSHVSNADSYQDARADVADMPAPVSTVQPTGWNVTSMIGGGLGSAMMAGGISAWQYHSNRVRQRAVEGRFGRSFGVFHDV